MYLTADGCKSRAVKSFVFGQLTSNYLIGSRISRRVGGLFCKKNRTQRKAAIKMSGSGEFATSLRKFKLVFLGEQSG